MTDCQTLENRVPFAGTIAPVDESMRKRADELHTQIAIGIRDIAARTEEGPAPQPAARFFGEALSRYQQLNDLGKSASVTVDLVEAGELLVARIAEVNASRLSYKTYLAEMQEISQSIKESNSQIPMPMEDVGAYLKTLSRKEVKPIKKELTKVLARAAQATNKMECAQRRWKPTQIPFDAVFKSYKSAAGDLIESNLEIAAFMKRIST